MTPISNFLSSLSDAALVLDGVGRVVDANGLAEEMFGTKSGGLIGDDGIELFADPASNGFVVYLRDLLLRMRPDGRPVSTELMGRRADGSLFPACVGRGSLEVDGFHGFTLLVRDLTADKARERQMLDGAIRDSLTGVNSRSGFEELSLGEVHRSGRYGRSLCAVLAELDHFHKINERYGRLIGDLVLLNVASALQSMLRRSDLIARWSGKKFAMLLVETESTQAAMAAERLRAAIADLPIPTPTGPITQTLSVGVAPITERRNDFAALFSDAERALQLAKELGRNRVEVALD